MRQVLKADLCVIVGGAINLVEAAGAGNATLEARVVVVERRLLGGECLYRG